MLAVDEGASAPAGSNQDVRLPVENTERCTVIQLVRQRERGSFYTARQIIELDLTRLKPRNTSIDHFGLLIFMIITSERAQRASEAFSI